MHTSPSPELTSPLVPAIVASVVHWLERAVIGLNLCPFAKAVHVKGQIHYRVSGALDDAALMEELQSELLALVALDAAVRDTTLLIVPALYPDFLSFQAFVARAERNLRRLNLDGVLQIAHFHPQFQFADAAADDIANYTNRAPYPILHLLREDSMDRAVAAFPDAQAIYEKNMQTLQDMGHAGWQSLAITPVPDAAGSESL